MLRDRRMASSIRVIARPSLREDFLEGLKVEPVAEGPAVLDIPTADGGIVLVRTESSSDIVLISDWRRPR